jgi:hypothetical protein
MKKLIILFIFCLGLSLSGKSQCNLPYKPLTEFGTDTTAFIIYNFMDRADCYKGKTLREVTGDLQMPIEDYVNQRNFRKKSKSLGINIYLYPIKIVNHRRETNQEINGVSITWEEEHDIYSDEFKKLRKMDGWNKDLYNYFKNMKIKKVETVIPMYSKYYEKYKPKETKSSTVPKTMILYMDSIHQ